MKNTEETKEIYTLGIWTVKPGQKDVLIKEWTKFANWTRNNVSGPGQAYLLQDKKTLHVLFHLDHGMMKVLYSNGEKQMNLKIL